MYTTQSSKSFLALFILNTHRCTRIVKNVYSKIDPNNRNPGADIDNQVYSLLFYSLTLDSLLATAHQHSLTLDSLLATAHQHLYNNVMTAQCHTVNRDMELMWQLLSVVETPESLRVLIYSVLSTNAVLAQYSVLVQYSVLAQY